MPLDGIMLHALKDEFCGLIGAKIDKITQPERDEIVLHLRSSKNLRLLLSANPSQPRIHLIAYQKENPQTAPNFCMLLRKHLTGARLLSVEQPGLERVLIFKFEGRTELFEITEKKLIIEIMGRHSNIILTDSNDLIYDCLRQVDFTASSKRRLLPALYYELPPPQAKIDVKNGLGKYLPDERIDKYLSDRFEGFSPLISREFAFLCKNDTEARFSFLSPDEQDKLKFLLSKLAFQIENKEYRPQVLFTDKPTEFYCFDILQYGASVKTTYYETCSEALDAFFAEKDKTEHMKRRSSDILKILTTNSSRISRKIEAQRGELSECEDSEKYKLYGDLIIANMYILKGGEHSALLIDYSSGEPKEIEVALNPSLSPSKNAQKYYKKYKKALTAKRILNEQIPKGLAELEYLNSVLDCMARANTQADLDEIRTELIISGYSYMKEKKKAPRTQNKSKPIEYLTTDGFSIFSGKNNIQNDYLTFKAAEKHDIWFHVKNIPGSHTILFINGKTPTNEALTQAAVIAAVNSKASKDTSVAVDYTEIKNVKKLNGAGPGMVTYDTYKTAYITPDADLCEKLLKS